MDSFTREQRSENMRRIKATNTAPEIAVRRALRQLGISYRLHRRDLPGKPDIVVSPLRTAVFVHGCFWHQHKGCRRAFVPTTRPEYWLSKLQANSKRDADAVRRLKEIGWRVRVVWECETRDALRLRRRMAKAFRISADSLYRAKGVEARWYRGWDLTDSERDRFRQNTLASQAAKARAVRGECDQPKHPIPVPRLRAEDLMPPMPQNGLKALSLFSGAGGLDLGFDRAGFEHVASFEIMKEAADVLRAARPSWMVYGGAEGDVCHVNWAKFRGLVDVLHGGPPCQPFSHAGRRSGANDVRDMFPELVRAIKAIRPRAFVAENVRGLATEKFKKYVTQTILRPLSGLYHVRTFTLNAADFGVPQRRQRVWFVGFRDVADAERFQPPSATHAGSEAVSGQPRTMGTRAALGLPDIGYDALAPTLRSGLTGPRHTTSVVNSVTALKQWGDLKIWPNGVALDREAASAFVAKEGHFRLSIADCMLLQGFPSDWPLSGPVYRALGFIGNAVPPPMAYSVAGALARALRVSEQPANASPALAAVRRGSF
jgi:DNA (cytosine-5)-methyltransferase 1